MTSRIADDDIDDPKIDTITPAEGWWVLREKWDAAGSECSTRRHRVAAWGSYVDDVLGPVVIPLVADRAYLRPAQAVLPASDTTDLNLWHDGDSWCDCRSEPFKDFTDMWWCHDCAEEIVR